MFNWKRALSRRKPVASTRPAAGFMFEGLEDRRLMSVVSPANPPVGGPGHGPGGPGGPGGHEGATITLNLAPAKVVTGLDALAGSTLALTTVVHLGNSNGVETYTVDVATTTKDTKYTVDPNGNAVIAPVHSTTTFGALTNTAVTGELKAIAAALNLTAPVAATVVEVSTVNGASTYSVDLNSATTTTGHGPHGARITVDASGNPVGDEQVPLSVLSAVIQKGLTSNAPTGATALTPTSLIQVETIDGVTLYSAHYTAAGVKSVVTVNAAGTLTPLPSSKQIVLSSLSAALQAELKTLAAAEGFTGTIAATQTLTEFDEANGTKVYALNIHGTSTTTSVNVAVDALGNPTTPPGGDHGGPGGDQDGPGGPGGPHH